ncbi:MAG: N,N-dimethylformamidase beta subunit family domain-containing protein [Rhodomicrobium sp.]
MKFSIPFSWPHLGRRNFLRLAGAAALIRPAAPVRAANHKPDKAASELWTTAFDGKTVWGYAGQHSVVPGESFALMLSTGPGGQTAKGHMEFFRIGYHPPDGQKLVWTSPELTVTPHAVSRTAAAIGAAWLPAIKEVPTADWQPGYYSADFVHSQTGEREPQTVQIAVRNPSPGKRVLLKLSTNTYQAYNAWGGFSLYPSDEEAKRGAIVAFDRPTWPAFFEYEVYLLRWLDELGAKHGFAVDCATDFDVHRDPALVADYALVISGSHDEYWSKEMFDAFERRIFQLGRNVIFFGADAAYCQVRYADVDCPPDGASLGRQIVCHRSIEDPVTRRTTALDPVLLATTWFRDGARRPETMLMGIAYQNWFEPTDAGPRYPIFVESAAGPYFEGTGYKSGDLAAEVAGYEWDNRDPEGDGKRLWDKDRSRNALLPLESIQVLFRGKPIDAYGKPGSAESVYFRSAAGAKVFSAGSVRWAWGLGKPGFERAAFKKFNENLVLDFLR